MYLTWGFCNFMFDSGMGLMDHGLGFTGQCDQGLHAFEADVLQDYDMLRVRDSGWTQVSSPSWRGGGFFTGVNPDRSVRHLRIL